MSDLGAFLSLRMTSTEVQHIEYFRAKLRDLADLGYDRAASRDQHRLVRLDSLKSSVKRTNFPDSLQVHHNSVHPKLVYPMNAASSESIIGTISDTLLAIVQNIDGHLRVVWHEPVIYVERPLEGVYDSHILFALSITAVKIRIDI